MTNGQAEILDKALEKLQKGQETSLELSLQDSDNALDLMVAAAAMIQALPTTAAPNPEQAQADRANFLARVEQLPAPAVPEKSPGLFTWLGTLFTGGTRAGSGSVVPTFAKAALILVVALLVSLGGTAIMAASALPTAPVYPAKLLMEETRLSLNDSPAAEMALHLAFAGERADEMAGLAAINREPQAAVLENFRAHWRLAMQLAGELPDEALQPTLSQMQTIAGAQETLLAKVQGAATGPVQERLQEAGDSLAQVQTAVQIGLQNRERYRLLMQDLPIDWPGKGFSFGPDSADCDQDCDEDRGYAPGPGTGQGERAEPASDQPGSDNTGSTERPRNVPGNSQPGNDAPGDSRPDSRAPSREDPGNDNAGDENPRNFEHGNQNSGNDTSGNETPGQENPGNDNPGNENSGSESPGDNGSGNITSGSESPGGDSPGSSNAGSENSGDEDRGADGSHNENPGSENSGDANSGSNNPGDGDSGNGDTGADNTGAGGSGSGDSGGSDGGGSSGSSDSGGKR